METLANGIARIKALPEALVDVGYAQGALIIAKQLSERTGKDESGSVSDFIDECKDTISALIQRCAPHQIPVDYLHFLSEYGGLSIDSQGGRFSMLGIGPMVEEWYSAIISDKAMIDIASHGLLIVGRLRFDPQGASNNKRVSCVLDIGRNLAPGCVIGVGPVEGITQDLLVNLDKHSKSWRVISDSFSNFIHVIAKTKGLLGYV